MSESEREDIRQQLEESFGHNSLAVKLEAAERSKAKKTALAQK
jgi:hypothetical protein